RLPVIAGCGGTALPDVVDLVRRAADAGARAVLVPPPFYYPAPPEEGLVRFFLPVLDASPVPVALYHIPAMTRVPITPGLVLRLAGHPRLMGAKDSSGDPASVAALAAVAPPWRPSTSFTFTASPASGPCTRTGTGCPDSSASPGARPGRGH
ncbi:MAG: dihydrodipicolinate synthase family protein, partial [Candidatus Sumerlaeia bacterium]|nr:dihydrodipicolinate synthase family protein [Candidatus Sumerlaeia bacterium]